MKKLLILLVFVSIFAQETNHIVKEGDTLWDIAGYYYQNPFLWPYIWRANLTEIDDPHWIYPEQVFLIPPSPEEGIGIPGELPTEVPPEEVTEYVPEEYVPMPPPPPKKVEAEVISVITPERRIFTEEIIHRAGFILDADLPYWGKIVGTEPRGEDIIASYKVVYIDRAHEVNVEDMLTIYRPGKVVTHPKTGARLGKEIIVLGKAEVEAVGNEGSRCKVVASYDIIKRGDFVTPYEPILAPEHVELIETTKDVEGYVVEVKSTDKVTPPHVFVYLDQGEEHGTAVGDMFDVYQKRNVGGKEQPDYDIAKVQVISVFRYASVGLLLHQLKELKLERGERCRLVQEAR